MTRDTPMSFFVFDRNIVLRLNFYFFDTQKIKHF